MQMGRIKLVGFLSGGRTFWREDPPHEGVVPVVAVRRAREMMQVRPRTDLVPSLSAKWYEESI